MQTNTCSTFTKRAYYSKIITVLSLTSYITVVVISIMTIVLFFLKIELPFYIFLGLVGLVIFLAALPTNFQNRVKPTAYKRSIAAIYLNGSDLRKQGYWFIKEGTTIEPVDDKNVKFLRRELSKERCRFSSRRIVVDSLIEFEIDIARHRFTCILQLGFSSTKNGMQDLLISYPNISEDHINDLKAKFEKAAREIKRANPTVDTEKLAKIIYKNMFANVINGYTIYSIESLD